MIIIHQNGKVLYIFILQSARLARAHQSRAIPLQGVTVMIPRTNGLANVLLVTQVTAYSLQVVAQVSNKNNCLIVAGPASATGLLEDRYPVKYW